MHNIGINNWALDRKQALDALDEFEKQGIAVLGGDVYIITDGIPESNYDNWYCDQNDKESFREFACRSIANAREYIKNYKHPNNQLIRFALVAKEFQEI